MKIMFKIVKRILFAFAVLYGFNIIMESLKLFIPLNIYTLSTVAVLGFPGLFVLVGILMI